jgi:Domain of unknown function (DUF4436)
VPRRRTVVVAVGALVLLYAWLLVLYAVSGRTQGVGAGAEPPPGGVRIDITVEGSNDRLTIGVDLEPDAALVSKTGLILARQVTVVLDPSAGSRAVVFPAGQIPAVDRIDLILDGDIRNWPLDRYRVALVVFASAGSSPDSDVLPTVVRIGRSVPGWRTTVDAEADDLRLSGVQQSTSRCAARATSWPSPRCCWRCWWHRRRRRCS